MDVKVLCPCGAKFLFEIEPVNGRMPAAVKCPVCGADGTEAANVIIAQKLAAAAPAPAPAPAGPARISIPAAPIKIGAAPAATPAAPVSATASPEAKPAVSVSIPNKVVPPAPGTPSRISVSAVHAKPAETPTPAPATATASAPAPAAAGPVTHVAPPPSGSPTRVSVGAAHTRAPVPEVPQAAAAAPVPLDPGVATCPKHITEIATAECFVCHKPICHKCMEDFGFLCSAYCKGQAQARKLDVPVFAGQRYQKFKAESRDQGLLIKASVAVVSLIIGVYIWYWFVGSRPKQAFKIETGPGTPFMFADWLGTDRFFSVTPARASMFSAAKGEEIWGFDLPKEIKGFKDKKDNWAFDFQPRVKVVNKDIWIALPQRVIRLDGATGKKEQEIPLGGEVDDFRVGEGHFLAISSNPTNDSKLFRRINLANGQVETQATPSSTGARRVVGVTRAMPGLGNTSLKNFKPEDEEFEEFHTTSFSRDPDFAFTGANVAHITRTVAERRIAVQAAVKPKPGSLLIDKQNVRASQGIEAARELINSEQEDVRTDESLYDVKIRRYFGGGAEWNGQVTGRPYFYSQKTVDLLVAGESLTVFDKNNRKLWEAKLTYPINPAFHDSDDESGPTMELGSRLYFYDQGVLTAFDIKKGDVQWRVNAVGIEGLATDSEGNLYISGTTSGPEDIKASGMIHNAERAYPQLFKVELKSGKLLWQSPRVGTQCMVSGKYVYTQYGKFSGIDQMSEAMGGDRAQIHWRLYRIRPGSGSDQWEYYRLGAPVAVRPNEKQILLHYKDALRVLRFL